MNQTKINISDSKVFSLSGDTLTLKGLVNVTKVGISGPNQVATVGYVTGQTVVGNIVTGATNLGTGNALSTGVALHKIQLKSLVAGSNITLTPTSTGITITSTATGGGAGTITGATNGLSLAGGGRKTKLGGVLTGATTIGFGTNNLIFSGTTGTLRYNANLLSKYVPRSIPDWGNVTGLTSQAITNGLNGLQTGITSGSKWVGLGGVLNNYSTILMNGYSLQFGGVSDTGSVSIYADQINGTTIYGYNTGSRLQILDGASDGAVNIQQVSTSNHRQTTVIVGNVTNNGSPFGSLPNFHGVISNGFNIITSKNDNTRAQNNFSVSETGVFTIMPTTQTGATTTNYVLTNIDGAGTTEWRASAGGGGGGSTAFSGATNGLTLLANKKVKLGGQLTGATTIGLGSSSLTFTGTTGTVKYGSNLSAQYTPRSIPDWGNVTGQTSTRLVITNFNTYSAATATVIAGKVLQTAFNIYSGSTATNISNRLPTSTFNVYSGSTNTRLGNVETKYVSGATNLGGNGLYTSVANKKIQLKGLIAGSNITLTPSSTGITITSTATVTGTTLTTVTTKTGTTYTLSQGDNTKVFLFTNSAPITVTLPSGITTGFQATIVKHLTAGVITLNPVGSILDSDGTTLNVANTAANLIKLGSTVWGAYGSLGTAYTGTTNQITGATNGLKLAGAGKRVGLGGTLTGNTTIFTNGKALAIGGTQADQFANPTLTSGSTTIFHSIGTSFAEVIVANDGNNRAILGNVQLSNLSSFVSLASGKTSIGVSNIVGSTKFNQIVFTTGTTVFTNSLNSRGIDYAANYSALYNARTLADWGSVTGQTAGKLSSTAFNAYSASTATNISNRLPTSSFNIFSGTTGILQTRYPKKSDFIASTGSTNTRLGIIETSYITGATNLGANGVYSSVSGHKLQLKNLIAGSNVTITPSSTGITISSTGGGGGGTGATNLVVTTKTGTTYTMAQADNNKFFLFTNTSPITITLPTGITTGFNASIIKHLTAGVITLTTSGGGVLDAVTNTINVANTGANVVKLATSIWGAYGSLGNSVSGGSSANYTGFSGATNGLTLTAGKKVRLGGTLTGNTSITGSSRTFTITVSGATIGTRAAGKVGNFSTSIGQGNIVSGTTALAIGNANTVIGQYAFAQGNGSSARGVGSIAFGNGSSSYGQYSYSEGQSSSSGLYSHAEGASFANNNYSHAEGNSTSANGTASHSEGASTNASGTTAHAEGTSTTAMGNYSHAEGQFSFARMDWSHAEGFSTQTRGLYAHAEGQSTIASGTSSHAEGTSTLAIGNYSHAEGQNSQARGNNSHAEGASAFANGDYSHAEGQITKSQGAASHAEGVNTISYGAQSHAQGQYTTTYGQASMTGGKGTSSFQINASGQTAFNYSENDGSQTVYHGASADNSAILGGKNHNIAVGNTRAAIIGGNAIKLTGTGYTDYVAVPAMAIFNTPFSGSGDDILTWNATTKKINKVTAASLTSGQTSSTIGVVTRTGTSYTIVSGDLNKALLFTNSAGVAVTLPSGITTGFQAILIKHLTAGVVTLTTSGGGTLASDGTTINVANSAVNIIKLGTSIWGAYGSLGNSVTGGTGAATVTGATNLGGTGLYTSISNKKLQFKGLAAGAGTTIVSSANTITIAAAPQYSAAVNLYLYNNFI